MSNDDDLLRATLDPDLDVRAFRRLFRPQSILWPSFFGGPLAGAILFGANYRRMNQRALARWCLLGGIVVTLLLGLGVGAYLTHLWGGAWSKDVSTPRWIRYAQSGVSVALAMLIAKHQQPRFAAWASASNEPASLWLPGFAAVLVGAVAIVASILFGLAVSGGLPRI